MIGLAWVAKGELIDVADRDGCSVPLMVFSNCGHATRAYHCVPCYQPLANVGNVLMHLEEHPDEGHQLVTFCERHRAYEAADQSQIDAFASVQVTP